MQAIYKITTRIIFRYIGMELCSGYTLNDLVEGKYEGPKLGTKREVLHQIILIFYILQIPLNVKGIFVIWIGLSIKIAN